MTDTLNAPRGSYENKGQQHDIPITIRVTDYFLASLICTAIEGGINYWCGQVELVKTPDGHTQDPNEVWNEWITRAVVLGGVMQFWDAEDETSALLTREKLLEGLARYVARFGHRIRWETQEDGSAEFDYDAGDADLIIQLALFGEIVYG